MSELYGTLTNEKSSRTLRASRSILATAQSWLGSVGVELYLENDGKVSVRILVEPCSTDRPARTVLDVPLSKLVSKTHVLRFKREK